MLLSEADEDSNGNITYSEFVPLAVEVITTIMGISLARHPLSVDRTWVQVIQTMRLKERVAQNNALVSSEQREAASTRMFELPTRALTRHLCETNDCIITLICAFMLVWEGIVDVCWKCRSDRGACAGHR